MTQEYKPVTSKDVCRPTDECKNWDSEEWVPVGPKHKRIGKRYGMLAYSKTVTYRRPVESNFSSHILYVDEDFTVDEINRESWLAIKVCEQGLSICKICGMVEQQLFDYKCGDKHD